MIRTAQELENLAYAVNAGSMTFKLANDIDLGKVADGQSNHTAIEYFSGTFDGDGHIIDNLTISSDENNQGLFGILSDGGTVKNVRLTNAKISGGINVGGIAGSVGADGCAVENCSVEGDISGIQNVGGVVGFSKGTVKNCSHIGAVSVSFTSAGGIVGLLWDNCSVENCINAGTVSSNSTNSYQQGVIYACVFGASGVSAKNCYYADNPSGVNDNGAKQLGKLNPPAGYKIIAIGGIISSGGEFFVRDGDKVYFKLEPVDATNVKKLPLLLLAKIITRRTRTANFLSLSAATAASTLKLPPLTTS